MSRIGKNAIQLVLARQALHLPLPPLWASGADFRGDHPAFPLNEAAREEALAALDRGETHYTDPAGIVPLREEVARSLSVWGLGALTSNEILFTAGEQEARFLAIGALVASGYELVLPSVVHPGARKAAAVANSEAQTLSVDPMTLLPNPRDIDRFLASTSKCLLYLESPNRLSGKIMERERVEAIAELVQRTEAIVIWDASLAPWVPEGFGYQLIGSIPGMEEHAVTLGSLWPGAGIEGWLAGYLASHSAIVAPMLRLKHAMINCSSAPVQWGALGALRGRMQDHGATVAELARIRQQVVNRVSNKMLPGEAATLVALTVDPADPSVDLAGLNSCAMSGDAFGYPRAFRFTVTPTGEILEALQILGGKPQ